jgi:hypothetical protein
VVAQKFAEKVQATAPAEVELKSPFVPLFQRGNFSLDINATPPPIGIRDKLRYFRNHSGREE